MTEHPPAAEPSRRSSPPDRSRDDARRRAIARRRVAVGIGVAALLAIGAVALLGGDVPLVPDGPDGPGDFRFALGNVQASPTSDTPPSELREVAREAGTGVRETLDELYFRAFVDPSSWGDYAAAFELFDGPAAASAEADVDVLTLGPTADDDYDRLDGASGDLTVAVLMDDRDAPATAVAEVRFAANAQRSDGTTAEIVSVGSYFLRLVDGEWRIFAYRVDREDASAAGPSPTGSP